MICIEFELEIHISTCITFFFKTQFYMSYAKYTLFLVTLMTAIYLAASKRKKPTCGCLQLFTLSSPIVFNFCLCRTQLKILVKLKNKKEVPRIYPNLKIAKQQIIFAPTHRFDNKSKIMSISRIYRVIGTSTYVMLVSNILLSNDAINMFFTY